MEKVKCNVKLKVVVDIEFDSEMTIKDYKELKQQLADGKGVPSWLEDRVCERVESKFVENEYSITGSVLADRKDTFEVGGIELERNKVYTAVKIVYDTPFCGITETGYYIFPDGISEDYDFNDLFTEDDAIAHAESFRYGFEDYLEQNVDGYDPENSEDFDTDGYYDDYVTTVMENCYCEEHEVCEADGDLDDADYMYVLTPDGELY